MRIMIRVALGAGAVLGLAAVATPAAHAGGAPGGGWGHDGSPGHGRPVHGHVVFVQTDAVSGNQVVSYAAGGDGTLSEVGATATGGLGGVLNGSVADHLGSQGSLAADPAHGLLYAVNAGSNSVSVFDVDGPWLTLRQVVGSGGTFPVSVAVHGDLVYVLNALGTPDVTGFVQSGGTLHRLWGSTRALGLAVPTDSTQFTSTPGQVAFSPNGSQLLVTTKNNPAGNDVDVFAVGPDGRPSAQPVRDAEPGTVPFAVAFDAAGHLVLGEAGPSSLATFVLRHDGTLVPLDNVASGQPGLCWVTAAGPFFFTGNSGSNSTSGYAQTGGGHLALLGSTPTDPGTVDGAATPDGRFLYVQTGGEGIVDEFAVSPSGSLDNVGSVTVPGAVGGEGIAAW